MTDPSVPFKIIVKNNFGIADDSKVYVTAKATNLNKHACFVEFNNGNTYCKDITLNTRSSDYAYKLEDLKDSSGAITLDIPPLSAGRMYFSVQYPVHLPIIIDQSCPQNSTIGDPDGFNTLDPNYYILYDKIEFSYTSSGSFVNPTAVDFFSIPIQISQPSATSAIKVSGFSSSRKEILDGFDKTISDTMKERNPSNLKEWGTLTLPFNNNDGSSTTLRLMSPGKAAFADGENPMFPNDYLTNVKYGINYVDEVWKYYSKEGNSVSIDCSEITNYHTAVGRIENGNFAFHDKTLTGPIIVTIGKPTSNSFFAGAQSTFNFPDKTPGSVIAKVLTAAFSVGMLPVDNNVLLGQHTYFDKPTVQKDYYTDNAYLENKGGPWWIAYSKGLTIPGQPIYTFAYDDVLNKDGTLVDSNVNKIGPIELTLGDMTGTKIPDPQSDTNKYDVTIALGENNCKSYETLIHDGKTIIPTEPLTLTKASMPIKVTFNGVEESLYLKHSMVKPYMVGIGINKDESTGAYTVAFPGPLNQYTVNVKLGENAEGYHYDCIYNTNQFIVKDIVLENVISLTSFEFNGKKIKINLDVDTALPVESHVTVTKSGDARNILFPAPPKGWEPTPTPTDEYRVVVKLGESTQGFYYYLTYSGKQLGNNGVLEKVPTPMIVNFDSESVTIDLKTPKTVPTKEGNVEPTCANNACTIIFPAPPPNWNPNTPPSNECKVTVNLVSNNQGSRYALTYKGATLADKQVLDKVTTPINVDFDSNSVSIDLKTGKTPTPKEGDIDTACTNNDCTITFPAPPNPVISTYKITVNLENNNQGNHYALTYNGNTLADKQVLDAVPTPMNVDFDSNSISIDLKTPKPVHTNEGDITPTCANNACTIVFPAPPAGWSPNSPPTNEYTITVNLVSNNQGNHYALTYNGTTIADNQILDAVPTPMNVDFDSNSVSIDLKTPKPVHTNEGDIIPTCSNNACTIIFPAPPDPNPSTSLVDEVLATIAGASINDKNVQVLRTINMESFVSIDGLQAVTKSILSIATNDLYFNGPKVIKVIEAYKVFTCNIANTLGNVEKAADCIEFGICN
jgi:hypothetical protein